MEKRNKRTRTVGNGEGSLYYSDKLDCLVFQYYYNNKRQTVKQKKNESNKEFKARVTSIKNELNTGTYIAKTTETLYNIIKRHIEQKFQDGIVSPISYKRNLETLSQLEKTCTDFINIPIQKVFTEHIENSKKYMCQYSQSCIDKMWGLLNKAFVIAYARRKINFNIMVDPTLTKPISKLKTEKIEALTINEQNKLEKLLDTELREHKYRNIVKFQLETAMRIGEISSRPINDYNKKDKTLLVSNTLTKNEHDKIIIGKHTKTYNKRTNTDLGKRTIRLSNNANSIITEEISRATLNIQGLIFWDYENNDFMSSGKINSWLSRMNKKYKITPRNLSTHVLRHTRITRWIEAGIAMTVVQYWAGHVEGSNITDNVYFSLQEDFINKEFKKIEEA